MKTPTVNRRTASYIVLGVTAVIIILTFFTATREFLYGIFGYAVYAYIPAALLTGILLYLGKKTTLPKSKVALYVALFFSALLTLRRCCSRRSIPLSRIWAAAKNRHAAALPKDRAKTIRNSATHLKPRPKPHRCPNILLPRAATAIPTWSTLRA